MNAIASLRERIRHSLPGGGPGDRPDLHGDPWREQVLATLLPVAAAAGAVAYVVKLFQVVRDGQWALAGIYTLAYAWILAIAVARRSKPQPLGPTPRPSGPGDRRGVAGWGVPGE